MKCRLCGLNVKKAGFKNHIKKHNIGLYDYGKKYSIDFYYIGKNKKIKVDNFDNKCKICGNDFNIVWNNEFIKINRCNTSNCSKKSFERVLQQLFKDYIFLIKEHNKFLNKRFTKEWYIDRYDNDGERLYNEKNAKSAGTKENFIKRYGKKDGIKHFEDFKYKSKHTREKYIIQYGKNIGIKKWDEYIKLKKQTSKRSLKYWLLQTDGDYELAKGLHSDYQNTSSLKKIIDKYGEREGIKKYNLLNKEKTRNWMSSGSISMVSKEFFSELNELYSDNLLFNDKEFSETINNNLYYFDCFNGNKIIEFYGDYWHCNPNIYNANDFHNLKKCTAKDIWDKDENRINNISTKYKILIIWENDVNKNKESVLQECLKFLED